MLSRRYQKEYEKLERVLEDLKSRELRIGLSQFERMGLLDLIAEVQVRMREIRLMAEDNKNYIEILDELKHKEVP